MKKFFIIAVTAVLSISFMAVTKDAMALKKDQTVFSQKIKDTNDKDKWIPYIGNKVVVISYVDPDQKDIHDPVLNAIKAANFPKEKFQLIIIMNTKDSWLPIFGIRSAARDKLKQFKGSVSLFDTDHTVKTKWGLGDCREKGVVIVIGKDKKVKYVMTVSSKGQSAGIKAAVLDGITKALAEIK